MLSPFPGMDPYLENDDHFRRFHNKFLLSIEEIVNPLLPEAYFADTGVRLWIFEENERREAYVEIFRDQEHEVNW